MLNFIDYYLLILVDWLIIFVDYYSYNIIFIQYDDSY